MELAAKKIEYLNAALEEIDFEKKSVKTTNFNVRTDYERVKDRNGNYKSLFNGYVCSHRLKVEFDFDTKRLAQTLYAISKCLAEPELSISFTVRPHLSKQRVVKVCDCQCKRESTDFVRSFKCVAWRIDYH